MTRKLALALAVVLALAPTGARALDAPELSIRELVAALEQDGYLAPFLFGMVEGFKAARDAYAEKGHGIHVCYNLTEDFENLGPALKAQMEKVPELYDYGDAKQAPLFLTWALAQAYPCKVETSNK